MVILEEGAPNWSTSARVMPGETVRKSSGDITGGGGSTGATSAHEPMRATSTGTSNCATGTGKAAARLAAGCKGGSGTPLASSMGAPGATLSASGCGSFSVLTSFLAAAFAVCWSTL